MANTFTLRLDTTAPANPTISIENGATYATDQLVYVYLGTTDGDTTGYEMQIWGDVDNTFDPNVQDTEAGSSWITFATSKQIKLSASDSVKTIYCKIRDHVWNVSAQVDDTITLDTTAPEVSISNASPLVISTITGKNECSFDFTCNNSDFVEYKVKVVTSAGATHDTGIQIPTTAGSTNMSGIDEATPFVQDVLVNCKINGADLKTASSGDGDKIIKVFVRDTAGIWSA